MDNANGELRVTRDRTAMVVCITETPEERTRLARLFDGVGVLVMASDPQSASRFLGHLDDGPASPASASEVRFDGLRVDLTHHEASWHGQPLPLTPHELKVLGCLASYPGRVQTYRQLYDRAWGGAYFTGPAAVQSVIKRLRAKLRQSAPPLNIVAVRGLGFRLVLPGRGAD